jgi:hypothetical protein
LKIIRQEWNSSKLVHLTQCHANDGQAVVDASRADGEDDTILSIYRKLLMNETQNGIMAK